MMNPNPNVLDVDAALDREDEHFEDFTNATEWEQFISNLEMILTQWQTTPIEDQNLVYNWVILNEKITFAEWPFKFSYYRKQNPSALSTSIMVESSSGSTTKKNEVILPAYLSSSINADVVEFPPRYTPHPIAEYYNLEEFAVLTSAALKPIENESKLKMLLSSACIAINNTNTAFSIHVQYHHWSENYFVGIGEGSGIRTDFHMIHLRRVPDHYWYLSGLIDIFKSKIGSNLLAPVEIAAHFFYTMKTWHPNYTFETELFDVIEHLREALSLMKKGSEPDQHQDKPEPDKDNVYGFTNFVPFGAVDDPFESLLFVAGWPSLSEDIVVDSANYSDLEPESASEYHFSLNVSKQVDYRLEQLLKSFWKLRSEKRTVEEILGKKLDSDKDDAQYMSALDRIAAGSFPRQVASLDRIISTVNQRVQKQLLFSPSQYTDLAPLPQADLDIILGYLFPDSLANPRYPYPSDFEAVPKYEKEHLKAHLDALPGIKSAPVGSLIWRLAIIVAYLHTSNGSHAIAHLWAELILELRYRFENSIIVVGDHNSSDQLITGDKARLSSSRYNRNLPLILVIHGFKNNYSTGFSRTLKRAYLSAAFPANIVVVNWKGAVPTFGFISTDLLYASAVQNVHPAGVLVAKFINFLIQEQALQGPGEVHMVGFSLGAHVAGVAGYTFHNRSQNNLKIQRITGLDPAGPLFSHKSDEKKLDKSDANFVDIVHTNKGMKGTDDVIGHVDFFPNGGGPQQPGCSNMTHFADIFIGTCSHSAAYKYFAYSILNRTIQACKCGPGSETGTTANEWTCEQEKCLEPVIFGQYCPETANGIYYLNISLPGLMES